MELPAILSTDVSTIYLNDHLAGATAGVELVARHGVRERERRVRRAAAQALRARSGGSRRADLDHRRPRMPGDHVKVAAGWTAEKIARLKPNGQLRGYAPLSRLLELETLLRASTARAPSGARSSRSMQSNGHPRAPGRPSATPGHRGPTAPPGGGSARARGRVAGYFGSESVTVRSATVFCCEVFVSVIVTCTLR